MRAPGRVAIVTGGGRGIGRAIAARLARDGFDLVLAGLEAEELHATATEVRHAGRRALIAVADVACEDQVRGMVDGAIASFGRIDVLVNNAAIIGPTSPVIRLRRSDWDEVLAVNLTGAMLCRRAVLPGMIARRLGKVINIASMAGKVAYPLRSAYAVSKWGLIGLTLTLAKEVGGDIIQVNAVCPGPVESEPMRRVITERASELGQAPEQVEREYPGRTTLGRMTRAEDVAALVAFLASPEADNIIGQAPDDSAGYGL